MKSKMTLLSIVALVLAVFTMGVSVFAWFYSNVHSDSNSFETVVKANKGIVTFEYLHDEDWVEYKGQNVVINDAMPGDNFEFRLIIKNDTTMTQFVYVYMVKPKGSFNWIDKNKETQVGSMNDILWIYHDDYLTWNILDYRISYYIDPVTESVMMIGDAPLEPNGEIVMLFRLEFSNVIAQAGISINEYQNRSFSIEAFEVYFEG